MACLGHINTFDSEKETISAHLKRVEMFFQAKDVKTEKRVPILLSVIGAKTYTLLRNLITPATPKDKSLDELSKLMKEHYKPKPLVIAERYHFHCRNQKPDESIAEYIAELKQLATHCEFGLYLEEIA